jgi:hypothetical protein
MQSVAATARSGKLNECSVISAANASAPPLYEPMRPFWAYPIPLQYEEAWLLRAIF